MRIDTEKQDLDLSIKAVEDDPKKVIQIDTDFSVLFVCDDSLIVSIVLFVDCILWTIL
jgi:hypothetical protein